MGKTGANERKVAEVASEDGGVAVVEDAYE